MSGAVLLLLAWGRPILVPFALATYLTFILAPLVRMLMRLHFGRKLAAVVVFCFAAWVVGSVCWVVTKQVHHLAAELPRYEENIRLKLTSLKQLSVDVLPPAFERMITRLSGAPTEAAQGQSTTANEKSAAYEWATAAGAYVLEGLDDILLAVVLLIFMLLNREDLRDRFIRIIGHGHITATTKAVEDGTQRIGRFLAMQALINAAYGALVAAGLMLIGLEYALLWGFIAGVLRYIPFIGAWVGAILPTSLTVAVFPGWLPTVEVIALFLVLDIINNNFLEPLLYGHSIGVSEVALLLSAAVWAFLWGPAGLILSGPLTVCLIVLGRHVPELSFFDVLLSDKPALTPQIRLYQRLIALDDEEAAGVIRTFAAEKPTEELYDELLLPVLLQTRIDRNRDALSDREEESVYRAAWGTLRAMEEKAGVVKLSERRLAVGGSSDTSVGSGAPNRCICFAARDEGDRIALEMFRQQAESSTWDIEVVATELLVSELLDLIEREKPGVVVIGAVPPDGLSHARYLCKRIRAVFPQQRIVVGRWGLPHGREHEEEELRAAGADYVVTSLKEGRALLASW